MDLFTLLLGLPGKSKGLFFRNVSYVMIIGKMLKPGFLSVIQELFV